MAKYKKIKVKVCPLKQTLVADILSKKEKRFSFLPKSSLNRSKSSFLHLSNVSFKRKGNLQKYSRSRIIRGYVAKKISGIKTIENKKICSSFRKNRLSFRRKLYRRFKKIFGNKRYNKRKLKLPVESANSLFYFKLTILIKKNNIFCNFSDFKNNKTLNSCSSGKYKIKVSKKTLKYTHDLVLNKFYKEIWSKVYTKIKKKEIKKNKGIKKSLQKGLFVNIVCSTRLRKKVCQYVYRKFKKIPLIINSLNKKIFNGCRPPKKVRKKRRKMRIYK